MQFWPRTLPLPGQQYCQGPGPVGQRLSLLSLGPCSVPPGQLSVLLGHLCASLALSGFSEEDFP